MFKRFVYTLLINSIVLICFACGASAKNGLIRNNGITCYYVNDVMQTGWQKIENKYYYFDKNNGSMQTGWVNDGGKYYYLSNDGIMLTSCWIEEKYYVNSNGEMLKDTMQNIGGKDYIFNSNGEGVEKPPVEIILKSIPNTVQASTIYGKISNFQYELKPYKNDEYEFIVLLDFEVINGLYSEAIPFMGYKIYDSQQYLVKSGEISSDRVGIGDKVKIEQKLCRLKKGVYTFEIAKTTR